MPGRPLVAPTGGSDSLVGRNEGEERDEAREARANHGLLHSRARAFSGRAVSGAVDRGPGQPVGFAGACMTDASLVQPVAGFSHAFEPPVLGVVIGAGDDSKSHFPQVDGHLRQGRNCPVAISGVRSPGECSWIKNRYH